MNIVSLVLASRHQKRHTAKKDLLYSTAVVEQQLSPNGTVLVNGELWPARSNNNTFISSRSVVRVVGLAGHRLLIEADDIS